MSVESAGYDPSNESEKSTNLKDYYGNEGWYRLLNSEDQLQIDKKIDDYHKEYEEYSKTKPERDRKIAEGGSGFMQVEVLRDPLSPAPEEYPEFIKERANLESKLLQVEKLLNNPNVTKEGRYNSLDRLYQDVSFRQDPEVIMAIFEGIKGAIGQENFDRWRKKMWEEPKARI